MWASSWRVCADAESERLLNLQGHVAGCANKIQTYDPANAPPETVARWRNDTFRLLKVCYTLDEYSVEGVVAESAARAHRRDFDQPTPNVSRNASPRRSVADGFQQIAPNRPTSSCCCFSLPAICECCCCTCFATDKADRELVQLSYLWKIQGFNSIVTHKEAKEIYYAGHKMWRELCEKHMPPSIGADPSKLSEESISHAQNTTPNITPYASPEREDSYDHLKVEESGRCFPCIWDM